MAKQRAGRASIFRGKENGVRIQGVLTAKGGKAFEQRRKELAKLVVEIRGEAPAVVSDADVIEYLALGTDGTIAALRAA